MKTSLLIAIVCSIAMSAKSQDPNFSQFFASPLTLNPAFTGTFHGAFRVAGNYRNQWPSINKAFITTTVSVDFKILQGVIGESDAWGIGLMGMTDKTAGGLLNSNFLSISTAYHKSLDQDEIHRLGMGFQATYGSKTIDGTRLHLGDELDPAGGWTIPSNDPLNGRTISTKYFDIGAGLLYSGSIGEDDRLFAGLSVYHLNQPKESFLNEKYFILKRRTTLHAGSYFPCGDYFFLHLSALHSRQAGAMNTVAGGAAEIPVTNDEESPTLVYIGLWYRWKDALIPYAGLEFGEFRLGMTYDINISALNKASNKKGGLELSLIYVRKAGDGKKYLPCPKF